MSAETVVVFEWSAETKYNTEKMARSIIIVVDYGSAIQSLTSVELQCTRNSKHILSNTKKLGD